MDRKRKASFPFRTRSGEEIFVIGMLFDSPYEPYFEIDEMYSREDPTDFWDEDQLTPEDLEAITEEAVEFINEKGLYR